MISKMKQRNTQPIQRGSDIKLRNRLKPARSAGPTDIQRSLLKRGIGVKVAVDRTAAELLADDERLWEQLCCSPGSSKVVAEPLEELELHSTATPLSERDLAAALQSYASQGRGWRVS